MYTEYYITVVSLMGPGRS